MESRAVLIPTGHTPPPQALSFLLPRLQREGHRPLLFSQWTAMLDVLQWLLDFLGMPWIRLDGR